MTDWFREWQALAPLTRSGLLILLAGAVSDTVAHLRAGPVVTGFTPQQYLSHVVILIGMLGVLLGILLNAIWPPRRTHPRDARHQ